MQDDERCCGTGTCIMMAKAVVGAGKSGMAKKCAALHPPAHNAIQQMNTKTTDIRCMLKLKFPLVAFSDTGLVSQSGHGH